MSSPSPAGDGCCCDYGAETPRVPSRATDSNADSNSASQRLATVHNIYTMGNNHQTSGTGLRICESVITAVLGGLPSGSVPVVRVTRYGSGRFLRAFLLTYPRVAGPAWPTVLA